MSEVNPVEESSFVPVPLRLSCVKFFFIASSSFTEKTLICTEDLEGRHNKFREGYRKEIAR